MRSRARHMAAAVIIIIMKSIIQMEKFLMKIPDGEKENSEHVPQSMSKEKVADLDAVKACNSPLIKGFSLIQWHIKKFQMTCTLYTMGHFKT